MITRENGDEIRLTNPGSIRQAIKLGWMGLASQGQGEYRSRPAPIQVHSPESRGRDRTSIKMNTAHEEETEVGTVESVRPDNAPRTHQAKNAGQYTVVEEQEGQVVGRFKSSAKAGTVEVGKNDQQIKRQLDNNPRRGVERVAPRISQPDNPREGVTVTGGSSIGGEETGRVVGRVSREERTPAPQVGPAPTPRPAASRKGRRSLPKDATAALREWVFEGETWDGQPMDMKSVRTLLGKHFRTLDTNTMVSRAEAAASEPAAPQDEPVWNLSLHWKTRESRVRHHAENEEVLQWILDNDSSNAVKKKARRFLEDLL